jgi:hypothetical protein
MNAQTATQPFVLERTVLTGERGQELRASLSETVARRSDGAISFVSSVGPVQLRAFVRKVSFADGSAITLFDGIRAKSTVAADDGGTVPALAPVGNAVPSDCGVRPPRKLLRFDKFENLDVAVIQGLVAKRYQVTEWRAPALGCEVVRYTSEQLNSDGTTTVSAEGRTTRLRLGEPDASLFDTGNGYTESLPSAARRQLLASIRLVLTGEEEQRFNSQSRDEDAVYERRGRNIRH